MKKKLYYSIAAILILVVILSGVFFVYAQDYYHANEKANEISANKNIIEKDNLIIVKSEKPSTKGFIFYPGAKVDEKAYLPLLEKLSEKGITCILVKMPLRFAIFDKNAAGDVMDQFPEIKDWYIGGHSLGGAMASSYASDHEDDFSGLILLGAYRVGDYPLEKTSTIYGEKDKVLNKTKIEYTENIFVIKGGNHAQFGDYGKQKGDGIATITADEQQDETIKIILEFVIVPMT